jgi:ribosomal protein L7Ae-like RNA K-turn-binding protein
MAPDSGVGPGGRSPARAVLDLLGLAGRARSVVAGTDAVRTAARDGKVRRVILATDTAPTQQQKLTPLLTARSVPFHVVFTRDELGAALGRNPLAAVGITDPNLARRIGELIAALSSPQDRNKE